jgi:hypoxanthine-DNA glycosylase
LKRLQGLAAVVDQRTRLVVLGSFPGVASLRAQRYYDHPRNQFWRILGAMWGVASLHESLYESRLDFMLAHGVGLWDVYGACEREGSLDADIRQGELNDFDWLAAHCPTLRAVAHNGGESHRHARHTEKRGWTVHKLPSTSPANASWSFDRKLAAWRAVFEAEGLLMSQRASHPSSD